MFYLQFQFFEDHEIDKIYLKLNKIDLKIIWKQFESPFLYYKNKKNLYLKEDDGKSKLDEKKIR